MDSSGWHIDLYSVKHSLLMKTFQAQKGKKYTCTTKSNQELYPVLGIYFSKNLMELRIFWNLGHMVAFGYGRLFTGCACTSGKHSSFYLEGLQDIRCQTYGLLLRIFRNFCWFVSPNMAVCFDSHVRLEMHFQTPTGSLFQGSSDRH